MKEEDISVRMPVDLKQQGDEVLKREAVSVSSAVRGLYEYLRREQQLPAFLEEQREDEKAQLIQRRKALMREMVGIIPPSLDLDEIKAERLSQQIQPGT
jgi:DNA-damage-inducible protein J